MKSWELTPKICEFPPNGSFSVPFLNTEVVTGIGYSTEPEMRDHGQAIDGFGSQVIGSVGRLSSDITLCQ